MKAENMKMVWRLLAHIYVHFVRFHLYIYGIAHVHCPCIQVQKLYILQYNKDEQQRKKTRMSIDIECWLETYVRVYAASPRRRRPHLLTVSNCIRLSVVCYNNIL